MRPERPTVKLNHLDLQVTDVPQTIALFEDLLGLRLESNRGSPAIAILTDGEGFTLVLQRRKDQAAYPEGFHFGFLVNGADTVRAFQAKACDRGLAVSEVIENNRGVLAYWRTSDGYTVEVSCQRRRLAECLRGSSRSS